MSVRLANRSRQVPKRYDDGPRLTSDAGEEVLSRGKTAAPPQGASFPPGCTSVMTSRSRSGCSDRRPPVLCPRGNTSSHASNEERASALSQGETAAPPQGASPSPWCDTVPASGQRSPRSDRRPLPRCPGRDTSSHTPRGATYDEALLREENAAWPRGRSPLPLLARRPHAELGSRRSADGCRRSILQGPRAPIPHKK